MYRHSDGFPETAGVDVLKFLQKIDKNILDKRFDDPNYLAARFVVFLAQQFNKHYDFNTRKSVKNKSPLDFISVGVVMEDPSDIEYRYEVNCDNNLIPEVKCFDINLNNYVKIPSKGVLV